MKVFNDDIIEDFEDKIWKRGKSYYNQGRVLIHKVFEIPARMGREAGFRVEAEVEGSNGDYDVVLTTGGGELKDSYCQCADFISHYYRSGKYQCKHIAATVMEFEEFAKTHSLYRTTGQVKEMIDLFQNRAIVKNITVQKQEKAGLFARLDTAGEGCDVSFQIDAGKKYVIPSLGRFTEAVEHGLTIGYGKNLQLLHHWGMFEEEALPFAKFIVSQIHQSSFYNEQVAFYGRPRTLDGRMLHLSPQALDELYELVRQYGGSIAVLNMKTGKKKYEQAICKDEMPKISMLIRPFKEDGAMQYVTLQCDTVTFLKGASYGYIVEGAEIYRVSKEYMETMAPIFETTNDGMEVRVSKEDMPVFYKLIVGRMRQFVKVEEEQKEEIEQVLPPEAEFFLYFDEEQGAIVGKPEVHYGEACYNLASKEIEDEGKRDMPAELGVYAAMSQYLPNVDHERMYMFTKDEDRIFDLLEHGFTDLMEYGEVRISDALKRWKVRTAPKVTVGVSVNSNLLDIDIQSEDFDLSELKQILKSYHLKKRYHKLKNGDFLQLDEGSVGTINELMEGMHISLEEIKKGMVKVPAYRALYLDKVLQESEGVRYNRDRYFKTILRNFKAVDDTDYEVPARLEGVLRTYQKNGYRWLRTIEEYGFGGILADDMGLGKTIQIITLLLSAKEEGKEGTSLIVCPASLVYNWEAECRKFAPELKVGVVAGGTKAREEVIQEHASYDVLVTSYELLKRDIAQYEGITFHYQVIDEAQHVKNHTTLGAKAVKAVAAKTKYALTGTPIENRLSELWSIFDYLMPGFLYQYEQFKKELETPITKNKEEEETARLRKMIQPFVLRRVKKDVLKDLPDKLEKVVYAKFDSKQQKLYDAYVSQVRERLASQEKEEFEKNKFKIFAELTRLRQICCDPILCYEDYDGESAKLDACLELVDNAVENGHKVLLFSQFTTMLDIIAERLEDRQVSYYTITGATKKEKRLELVNAFNEDDTSVFLISLKAGGTGLNLTAADMVIHYDPWWNVAAQNQATDRAHRIGQKNVVTVLKLIAKGTIEEKIIAMQEEKKNLADQIISGEMNRLSSLNKDELLELLSV